MSYVVNNHLNNLYVLSNKAVGTGKNSKLTNVGPTSIPESRVFNDYYYLNTREVFENIKEGKYSKRGMHAGKDLKKYGI